MRKVYLVETTPGRWDIVGPKGNMINEYPFRGTKDAALRWGVAYMSYMQNIVVELKETK